jgi:hypothetical protein
VYLLARFRDKRAFPLILKMVTGPGDSAHEILGDTIMLDLGRILASVYDGNLDGLKQVIENRQLNQYVRSGVLQTLQHLVGSQQMPREQLVEYLHYLMRPEAERDDCYIWDQIISVVVSLPAPELLEQVSSLFGDDRLCIEGFIDADEVTQEMELSAQDKSSTDESLITDVIKDVSWWACFEPGAELAEDDDLDEDWLDEATEPTFEQEEAIVEPLSPVDYEPPTPYVREGPKVGRNDPCPCGSGTKYKKCCG